MIIKLLSTFRTFICVALIVQLMGCGTILYPERRGQKAGHLDVGVVLLDGIGLLFFLIPGIIAYAVDFSNGTIYLPGTSRVSLDLENIKQVKFDPKLNSLASIEKIIKEETGYAVKLDQPNLQIHKIKSTDDMMVKFSQALPEIRDNRVALLVKGEVK